MAASDAVTAGRPAHGHILATTSIGGRIHVIDSGSQISLELHDSRGGVYRLRGEESAALASVDGGDIVVRGTFDEEPGLVVREFIVIGMNERAVWDGVLEATESGWALRLFDGEIRVLRGLDSDLRRLVGARMWVRSSDGTIEAFGLITTRHNE